MRVCMMILLLFLMSASIVAISYLDLLYESMYDDLTVIFNVGIYCSYIVAISYLDLLHESMYDDLTVIFNVSIHIFSF